MPTIKKTKLQKIIDAAGITKAELGRLSGVNGTTLSGLCKGVVIINGKVVATKDSTKSKVVNAINDRAGTKFTLDQVFPSEKK